MILLFDTSTPTGLLLVGDRGRVLASATWTAEQSHSQKLPPYIKDALKEAGMTTADLTHIGVGIGPGSFTGLRVALATAKGLGIALGTPIVAIPSLELFAAGSGVETKIIAATTDAFRGEIYLGIYERTDTISLIGEIQSLKPDRAVEKVRAIGKPVTITGTGYHRYRPLFDASLPPLPCVSPPLAEGDGEGKGAVHFPAILRLAEQYIQNNRTTDPAAVLPYYVREAEAVEKISGY